MSRKRRTHINVPNALNAGVMRTGAIRPFRRDIEDQAPTPPSSISAPSVSGDAVVPNGSLSTTNGTWRGTRPITYAYKWFRDAVEINGATSQTYGPLLASDIGASFSSEVTASNPLGDETTASTASVEVVDERVPRTLVPLLVTGSAVFSIGPTDDEQWYVAGGAAHRLQIPMVQGWPADQWCHGPDLRSYSGRHRRSDLL